MSVSSSAGELRIDEIVYVASLVSDAKAVDNTLDRLREITAVHRPGIDFSDTEVATLNGVYHELEQYLATRDPQRKFSPEELRQKVADKTISRKRNGQLVKKLFIIIGLALGFGGLSLLAPMPASEDSAFEFYLLLTIPTVFTILHFGSAWLFVSALQYFQTTLKVAYRLIASGIVVLGLAQLQLVVLGLFDLWSTPWITIGIISVTFSAAFCLIYAGVRVMGRLWHIRTLLTSHIAVAGYIAVVCAAVVFTPHYSAPVAEVYIDIGSSGLAISTVLAGIAALTSGLVSRLVSTFYKRPLEALALALGLMAVSGLQLLVVQLGIGYHTWYDDSGLTFLPLLLAALAFVRAGYLFNKVSNY